MERKVFSAKKTALGGILAAVALILLYFEAVTPVNKLSLYALSSFLVSIVIIESGVRTGWIFYAATSLLAFLVVPDKLVLIPYAGFFGLYGIVKYYIEKLKKLLPEYALKLICFNVFVFISALFIGDYLLNLANLRFPWWVLLAVFQPVFLVYDYVYTLFIDYYRRRIKGRINL